MISKFKIPKGWRTGQYIFNLLEFIKQDKGGYTGDSGTLPNNPSERMYDPFYMSDEELEEYINKFNQQHENK